MQYEQNIWRILVAVIFPKIFPGTELWHFEENLQYILATTDYSKMGFCYSALIFFVVFYNMTIYIDAHLASVLFSDLRLRIRKWHKHRIFNSAFFMSYMELCIKKDRSPGSFSRQIRLKNEKVGSRFQRRQWKCDKNTQFFFQI